MVFFSRQLTLFFDENQMFNRLVVNFPWGSLPDIAGYFVAYVALLFFLNAFLSWGSLFFTQAWHLPSTTLFKLGVFSWCVFHATTFFINQEYFPSSQYADMTRTFMPSALNRLLLYAGLFYVMLFTIFSLCSALLIGFRQLKKTVPKKRTRAAWLVCLVGFLALLYLFQLFQTKGTRTYLTASTDRPNFIIIGIDSLRTDYLQAFGRSEPVLPHLEKFLSDAQNFQNTLTPLGQTFGSWMSLLTGLYPIQNGARYDLIHPRWIDHENSLAKILKKSGYETIYATDEVRFSNIDQSYGFDHVITPPMGASDFLLGTFSDTPLFNLVAASHWGRYLFPFNHANRAALITYYPEQFNRIFKAFLEKPHQQPFFLAMHLCLPHWPFVWGNSSQKRLPDELGKNLLPFYETALEGVDKQFAYLMKLLKKQGWLKNTWVIVIADHGEAFMLPNDRITAAKNYRSDNLETQAQGEKSRFAELIQSKFYPRELNQTVGHGNDVLSLSQHQVLMAFRYFGTHPSKAEKYHFPTMLVDIHPTVLALANGYEIRKDLPGLSLAKFLKTTPDAPQDVSVFTQRPRFIETSYWPEIKTDLDQLNLSEFLKNTTLQYRVLPDNNRVVVDDGSRDALIAQKQRAVYQGNWGLALYPWSPRVYLPVLVNLKTGEWTDDPNSSFAQNSPYKSLLNELKQLYGNEIQGVIR